MKRKLHIKHIRIFKVKKKTKIKWNVGELRKFVEKFKSRENESESGSNERNKQVYTRLNDT